MSSISRINYKKNAGRVPDFEMLDLQLFLSTYPPKMVEKDYRINFWVILYITEGEGVHYIDFQAYHYAAGDILFIQKNQVHRFVIDSDSKGYIMHINEPFLLNFNQNGTNVFLEFADQSFGSPVVSVDCGQNSTNRKLVDILYTEYNKKADSGKSAFIKSLFESFILSIRQQFTVTNQVLKTNDYRLFSEFRTLVEDHYSEHLVLDDYSEMMGVSKKTINKATRSIADLSAKDFVNRRLFLEIKRHLSLGELLIYEISDLMGFDEPSNMTKFFKKFEGISPKQFQKERNI